mmetsp:Transcript_7721/g.14571  ORF Transcript_7721/g.14571 Transcript_7721/m.14571 type:complete len:239 (+) Transcript_7721:241-957(+)
MHATTGALIRLAVSDKDEDARSPPTPWLSDVDGGGSGDDASEAAEAVARLLRFRPDEGSSLLASVEPPLPSPPSTTPTSPGVVLAAAALAAVAAAASSSAAAAAAASSTRAFSSSSSCSSCCCRAAAASRMALVVGPTAWLFFRCTSGFTIIYDACVSSMFSSSGNVQCRYATTSTSSCHASLVSRHSASKPKSSSFSPSSSPSPPLFCAFRVFFTWSAFVLTRGRRSLVPLRRRLPG